MVFATGRVLSLSAALAALSMLALPAAAQPQAQSGRAVDVVVVLHDDAHPRQVARDHRAEPEFVYEAALNGFAGSVPEGRLRGLSQDPRVRSVERDTLVETTAETAARVVPTGIARVGAETNTAIAIDGRDERVDVDVAVIDTGIDLDHPDLNVASGVDCLGHSGGPPRTRTYSCKKGGDDGHGHGTHVAGTIAALDDGGNTVDVDGVAVDVVGVAPGARLHAVKVLDDKGSGSTGSVIAGIDWVTANADTIEVANMSLGGGGESTAMDVALKGSYEAGITYAVAAGNSGVDVDNYHPAGSPWVLTVSALADFDGQAGGGAAPTCRADGDDTFANFSNYGAALGQDVDIIAPGVCILSTYHGGGYAGGFSGTSMASPHVAGAAALLASAGARAAEIAGVVDGGIDGDGIIEAAGNFAWDAGDDPDELQEPLLDVGDETVFTPRLVASTDGGGEAPGDGETSDPGGEETIDWVHVHDLAGSSSSQGGTWTAAVTVHVHDSAGDVSGQTVTFSVSSAKGTLTDSEASCTTAGDGRCSVDIPGIPKKDSAVTFTVTGSLSDSHTATELTVAKP